MYRSPEDSPCMLNYRAAMRECLRVSDCLPVKHNCDVPSNGGSAMMGRGFGGGGRGGAGRAGGSRSFGGRPHGWGRGFGARKRGPGIIYYGGPWYGGPWFSDPCYDPYSYECFLATRGAASSVSGDSMDYYSRVQAWNLLPRLFPFPR